MGASDISTAVLATNEANNAHDARARAAAARLDQQLHALVAQAGTGLSPISLGLAGSDWLLHLLTQPGQLMRLTAAAHQASVEALGRMMADAPVGQDDPRFQDPAWQTWPWRGMVTVHQAAEAWWRDAASLRGMASHHRALAKFTAAQWFDMLAPSNGGALNPEVIQRTRERRGANLLEGATHVVDDWRERHGLPRLQGPGSAFKPGIDVAITPGKVVHRNHLVELIQYLPLTASVQAEPVFIVPSWIMKYYILDLSPHNSLVKWLVERGHTVFILSWRNPDESDALLGMQDYLELGIFDSLAAIARLVPEQPVHACGYCLGGTLLSIAAAALGREGDVARGKALAPLQSVTLLAAEVDFSEPGEMGVLIDESQVTLLEEMMAERGFLSGRQMAGSFAYLQSRERVWSRTMREVWLGERSLPNDLAAWNADVTRMPAVMHSEYLRRCYLRNELAESKFPVEGRPVSLADVHTPLFVVGTERDHVSPWKSVYKIHRLTGAELCFVLTSGGHNAGIVSEPGHAHRHFAMKVRGTGEATVPENEWLSLAVRQEGSWWPAWHDWLTAHGSGALVKARTPSAEQVRCDAPGTYVHVRHAD